MTTLKLSAGGICSVVQVSGSKSYANRALILAALKPGSFTIHDLPAASDVGFLLGALPQIGLEMTRVSETVTFINSFPDCENPSGAQLEIGEGGTSARFLAALLLMGKAPYELILGPRLKQRPWQEFIDLANSLGAKVRLVDNRLFLQGPIRLPPKLTVNCRNTTQFASGLQMATAFSGTEVLPEGLESSQSYWQMTQALIDIIKATNEYVVPKDWSSASYPLAFASLNQAVFFPGLFRDSYQADEKICELLEKMQVIHYRSDGIEIKPRHINLDINMNVSDCLDLVPTLIYLLSHIQGNHILTGFHNLIHKESDRLSECCKLLSTFGVPYDIKDNKFSIQGSDQLKASTLNLVMPDDHRMVMAGALFLRHHAGGDISPQEAVKKSYPEFWTLFPQST